MVLVLEKGASHGQYGHGIGLAWLENRAYSLKQIMKSTSGICHLVANFRSVIHLVTNVNAYVKLCNVWR